MQAVGDRFESDNLHQCILGDSMEDLQQDLEVAKEQEAPAIEESTVDPLAELQKELAEAKDQYLRARADTENVRRRGIEDAAKARKFAIESFAENLIPVADTLYAALEHAGEDVKKELKVVLDQLTASFAKSNLKEISPSITDTFDPHKHQAISAIESNQPINTIIGVLQKGYMIADRVLRPAMVTVSKGIEEKSVDKEVEDN